MREISYDILMDTLYVIGIGYMVYTVIDQLTDRRFSRELSIKYIKTRAKIREYIDREREYSKSVGRMLFEAFTTIDESGGNGETNREV